LENKLNTHHANETVFSISGETADRRFRTSEAALLRQRSTCSTIETLQNELLPPIRVKSGPFGFERAIYNFIEHTGHEILLLHDNVLNEER
jgi:hypothetical protein